MEHFDCLMLRVNHRRVELKDDGCHKYRVCREVLCERQPAGFPKRGYQLLKQGTGTIA